MDKLFWRASYGEYVLRALPALGVELRLGTRATAELLRTAAGETVVLATGAHPCALASASPQDGPTIVDAAAYLAGRGTLGERVVVVSNGEGAEFAVALARMGHRVWLLERGVALCPAVYDYAGRRCQALTDYLAEAGVHLVGLVDAVQPTAGGVIVCYRNGHREPLPTDTVFVAGRQARHGPTHALVPPGWDRLPGRRLCCAPGDCGGAPGGPGARNAALPLAAVRGLSRHLSGAVPRSSSALTPSALTRRAKTSERR
jgi:Pyridine nucleotide-disulphide oxidoreductase